jgi:hypothetical protein
MANFTRATRKIDKGSSQSQVSQIPGSPSHCGKGKGKGLRNGPRAFQAFDTVIVAVMAVGIGSMRPFSLTHSKEGTSSKLHGLEGLELSIEY